MNFRILQTRPGSCAILVGRAKTVRGAARQLIDPRNFARDENLNIWFRCKYPNGHIGLFGPFPKDLA